MGTVQDHEIDKLNEDLNSALLTGNQTKEVFFKLGDAYNQRYKQSYQSQDLESAIKYYTSGLEEGLVHWQ